MPHPANLHSILIPSPVIVRKDRNLPPGTGTNNLQRASAWLNTSAAAVAAAALLHLVQLPRQRLDPNVDNPCEHKLIFLLRSAHVAQQPVSSTAVLHAPRQHL